jgi:hypothetical protein
MADTDTKDSSLNRRAWIQGMTAGAAWAVLPRPLSDSLPAPLAANEGPTVLEAVRAMSAITGKALDPAWLTPTSEFLDLILRITQPLRALDVVDLEPSTQFTFPSSQTR